MRRLLPPCEGSSRLINSLIAKVFGTKNERVITALMPKVEAINAFEPQMQKLTDAELRAKTDESRQRIQERLSRFDAEGSETTEDTQVDTEAQTEPDPIHMEGAVEERQDAAEE